jgi:predicted secreted hydrolase
MRICPRKSKPVRARATAPLKWAGLCVFLLSVATSVWAADDFLQVTGPCNLSFPKDHGPHIGFRTEWWYYTGNLTDAANHRYGFQLTFFRRQLAPTAAREQWPVPASSWRTDQVYLAHAAVTDIDGGRHLQAETMARPVLSMAGAEQAGTAWKVHIGAWQTTITESNHHLSATADGFALDLNLTPVKPVVRHGIEGYSQKGQSPERASCYYSFTRLEAQGSLSIEGQHHAVAGSAWMDHEFSTAPLEPGISGWDWFSLQLADRTEIMVFLLRRADGSLNSATSGTAVLPSGETRHLGADDIDIRPLAHWTSPHSGARYPVKWAVTVPVMQVELTVTANLDDQEMHTRRSTMVVYWEGSVRFSGSSAGKSVNGTGYVEMTGYAEPFDTDL